MPDTTPDTAPAAKTVLTLIDGLIDYAGLFPPAKLDMPGAVSRYARYIAGEQADALGRFICPVSRLREFAEAAEPLISNDDGAEPWYVSAVVDGPLDECVDAILDFNESDAAPGEGPPVVDAVELRAPTPGGVDEAIDKLPGELAAFFELPVMEAEDIRGHVAALSGTDASAKIRCGGVTNDAFPTAAQVAAFIDACANADVPFKATAGLHHPIRAEHPLTYDADPPRGVMHGFVNVFVGAAMRKAGVIGLKELETLLLETDAGAFEFGDEEVAWRKRAIADDDLAEARSAFATSYGSCSFEEPIDDLQKLNLL